MTSIGDEGPLQSPMVKPGDSFTFTFDGPETYAYRCLPHSSQNKSGDWVGMTGSIAVTT